MTRLLIDESLPPLLAELLQSNGIESDYAGDLGLAGRPDEDVYALARGLMPYLLQETWTSLTSDASQEMLGSWCCGSAMT